MVDAVGTTVYSYAGGVQLWTEDGPWSSDTVTNTYNNRLRTGLSLAQPTGSWTNGFYYDPAKRLTNVTSKAGSFTYTLGATASASPLIKKLALPNTSYITNVYDGNARMLSTTLMSSTPSVLNAHTYAYNPGNQRTQQVFSTGSTYNYTYDPIGQLKIADSATASEDRGYTYDAAWNLNYRTNNTTLNTFKVDPKNQLTNATPVNNQAYDGNGNVTSSESGSRIFSYDDENRLRTNELYATSRSVFTYDGLGRLRQREEYAFAGTPYFYWYLTATVRHVYDGMRVIQERNESNTPQVSYTRGADLSGSLEGAGGIGGMLGRSQGYSSGTGNWSTHHCYHADGNGNITYVESSAQGLAAKYRYDPYGNTISSSGSLASANTYRFSSKEINVATGLYYSGFRFYSPNLQRWPNRDPIGERGGKNLFGMVENQPVNRSDLLGLAPCGNCGPDVTAALDRTLTNITMVWNGWDDKQRRESCDALYKVSDGTASHAWFIEEIATLGFTNSFPISGAPPGTKGCCGKNVCCDQTVTYKGHCYFAGDLNYLMFGVINKLCDIPLNIAEDAIAMWKQYNAVKRNCAAELDFIHSANIANGSGYNWEFTRLPEVSKDADCKARVDRGSDRMFKWHWEPHHKQPIDFGNGKYPGL